MATARKLAKKPWIDLVKLAEHRPRTLSGASAAVQLNGYRRFEQHSDNGLVQYRNFMTS